jgi:iron complex outermembrane recepter protein
MPFWKGRSRSLLFLGAAISASAVAPAHAQNTYNLSIPAQPLPNAISAFTRATGAQILFTPSLLADKTSRRLAGVYTREAALGALLKDTGLTFQVTPDNFLLIQPVAAPPVAPQRLAEAAQTPAPAVIVRGVRPRLAQASEAKRTSEHFIEGVTSEDIEKHPDATVADSLQRLAGVAVSRSHGEGYQVSVRGFGPHFNTVLLDGDLMPSRNFGREFNFNDLSSDFVNAVTVYKTAPVDLPAGGIGSTINIRMPQPFDYPKRYAAVTAAGTFDIGSEGWVQPVLGGLVSGRFWDGKVGFLASLSRHEFNSRENSVSISAWKRNLTYLPGVVDNSLNETDNIYTPQSWRIAVTRLNRTRINGRFVIQARPVQDVDIAGYYQFSDLRDRQRTTGLGTWFTTTDPSTSGVRTNAHGTVIDYFQHSALDVSASNDSTRTLNNAAGASLKWRISERLSFAASAQLSRSEQNPDGQVEFNVANAGYPNQSQFVLGQGTDQLPVILRYNEKADGSPGGEDDYLQPGRFRAHIVPRYSDNAIDNIRQARGKLEWSGVNLRLRLGADITRQTKKVDIVNNADVMCTYCGYPSAPDLPDAFFDQQIARPSAFIQGYRNAQALPGRLITFDAAQLIAFLQQASGRTFALSLKPNSYEIREQTVGGFAEAKVETALLDKPATWVAGLRYEATHLEATGQERKIEALNYVEPTIEDAVLGDPVHKAGANRYGHWLPALDFRLDIGDGLVARLGVSRTLSRPSIALLYPTRNYNIPRPGNFSAIEGNPNLEPYISDNMDGSVEWYYAQSSYVALGIYRKRVSNFIYNRVFNTPVGGLTDPATGINPAGADAADTLASFMIVRPENGGRVWVWGGELAFQHQIGATGFAVQGNISLVDTDRPFDPFRGDETFAVTGLGNSANFAVSYDKQNFQARISANWRDGYLAEFAQSQDASEPTFMRPYTQVDASFGYRLPQRMEIFGYINNLTEASRSAHGRFSEQFLYAVSGQRRVTLGVRRKF